jgi:hypothetical protein
VCGVSGVLVGPVAPFGVAMAVEVRWGVLYYTKPEARQEVLPVAAGLGAAVVLVKQARVSIPRASGSPAFPETRRSTGEIYVQRQRIPRALGDVVHRRPCRHDRLDAGKDGDTRQRRLRKTAVIAIRITGHCRTVEDLLSFRATPPPWSPPKRRGRLSRARKAPTAQWCT